MNRLKSYSRIAVLTLCAFVVFAVQSLAETSQRFTLPATEAFIAKWSQSGGSELGSSQNFLLELCDLLEVPRPSSPRADLRDNTYTFEKQVSLTNPGGKTTSGRIDLYKRGAFIWESKQGSDSLEIVLSLNATCRLISRFLSRGLLPTIRGAIPYRRRKFALP